MSYKTISEILDRIDNKGYKAYRRLLGAEEALDDMLIRVVKVQGDPYAPPSTVKVVARISAPKWALEEPVPLADWLTRRLYGLLSRYSRRVGEGRSGYLGIPRPSPVIIRRSSVEVRSDRIIARIHVGLPSRRRRILGDSARELLLERIPRTVREVLDVSGRVEELRRHIYTWRMQEYIRGKLPSLGLVSFIGDGSILPRKCGGCEEPLPGAIPFESPSSLRTTIMLPWGEEVTGMGVRRGVTVIAGSAFHGKSTLLEAVAAGVWNHIPGDGREKVVTIREAVYVRAEDGRYVSCVDVSSMIHNLPGGQDTRCFSTNDASGATSIAASIQEAVEVGAKLIMLDEDTASTNMLYLDERAKEITRWHTITPITMLVESMKDKGISLIIVSSGSLPLLAVADTVVVMEAYRPVDMTEKIRQLVKRYNVSIERREYREPAKRRIIHVVPLEKPRIRGWRIEDRKLPTPIPLSNNIHLVEEQQLNTLLEVARKAHTYRGKLVSELARDVEKKLTTRGPSVLGDRNPGLAEVRAQDIAYMLNRLHTIRFSISSS